MKVCGSLYVHSASVNQLLSAFSIALPLIGSSPKLRIVSAETLAIFSHLSNGKTSVTLDGTLVVETDSLVRSFEAEVAVVDDE